MNRSPEGTTAIVTGAARRIGRAIAHTLADNGMNVVVHYNHSASEAKCLVADLKKKGVAAWAAPGDLTNEKKCTALIDKATTLSGNRLTVLVNNASIFPPSTLQDITFADLSRNIRINAWAPLCLSRAFAASTRRGCIVNILDNRITGSDRGHLAYLLSKQMLASLTEVCARELAPGIRVNGVAPGLILPPAGKTGAYLDKLKSTVPLRIHGMPADVAGAALFCIRSPFLTGEIIFINGGKHLPGPVQ